MKTKFLLPLIFACAFNFSKAQKNNSALWNAIGNDTKF